MCGALNNTSPFYIIHFLIVLHQVADKTQYKILDQSPSLLFTQSKNAMNIANSSEHNCCLTAYSDFHNLIYTHYRPMLHAVGGKNIRSKLYLSNFV